MGQVTASGFPNPIVALIRHAPPKRVRGEKDGTGAQTGFPGCLPHHRIRRRRIVDRREVPRRPLPLITARTVSVASRCMPPSNRSPAAPPSLSAAGPIRLDELRVPHGEVVHPLGLRDW